MKIKKSQYLLVHILLAVSFWNFAPLSFLNTNLCLILSILWSLFSYLLYNRTLNHSKYSKYNFFFALIIFSVLMSMFSAQFFWGQNFLLTAVGQRTIYAFIVLPSLLYTQPSLDDIVKVLRVTTYSTIIFWIIGIISPNLINSISEEQLDRLSNSETTDIGVLVPGMQLCLIYLYYLIQEYIKQFSLKKFLAASLIILFFILAQNRSYLIGIILITIFSFFKYHSKYKGITILIISIIGFIGLYNTIEIWMSLIEETILQLTNLDYNRWKALSYYFNDYSPNLFCYIFGNGTPYGEHSEFGLLTLDNMKLGIFASDLGLIGMWTVYGIIPIIAIYYIVLKVVFSKTYPLMLRFICFHILVIPTIFNFSKNPGIMFFCIVIYLYAHSNEAIKQNYANNYIS